MTEPAPAAQETLRGDILAMGRDGFVSMADIESQVSRGQLADSTADRQRLIVSAIRSLLEDELVEVGVPPVASNPNFERWPGTADEVTTRFVEHFVAHYENRIGWEYAIWVNLTAKGEEASAHYLDEQ